MQNLSKVYENVNENQKLKNEIEKSKKQFEYKPYVLEYYELAKICTGANFIFSFFSIATGFYFLYSKFLLALGFALSIFFTIFILSLIEFFKNKIGNIFFTKIYSKGMQIGFLLLLIGLVLAILASVLLSVFGAKELYLELDKTKKVHNNAHTIKKDSLVKYYDNQIKDEKTGLKSFLASVSWNGAINIYDKTISTTIAQKNEIIKNLQIDKQKSLNALDRNAGNDLQNIESKSGFNLIFWLVLSAINEFLIIVCTWYAVFYRYKVNKESDIFDVLNEPKFVLSANDMHKHFSNVLLNTNEIATKANENYTLNTIANETKSTNSVGFVIGAKHTHTPAVTNDTTPAVTKNIQRACKNCGAEYVYKQHTQKYCSEACRIDFWQKEKNKKLFFKSKS